MRTFNIDGVYIQAPDEESAREVLNCIRMKMETRRFIYLRSNGADGLGQIIDMPEDGSLEIWTKYDDSVQYCGKIMAGTGHKILQAAIDNVNISQKDSAKLGQAVRKAGRKRKHDDEQKVIVVFEHNIPDIAKSLYADVMNRLEATTIAYKLEIYDGLEGTEIKSHNWMPILVWFRDKVLDSEEAKPVSDRRTFFQLRKAFVTAAARMARDNVRHSNTMGLVKEDGRDEDFWVKYGEDKTGG